MYIHEPRIPIRDIMSGMGRPQSDTTKTPAGRKRAQRAFPITPDTRCAKCNDTGKMSRNHKDGNKFNNSPENIEILCWDCHAAADVEAGLWGHSQW